MPDLDDRLRNEGSSSSAKSALVCARVAVGAADASAAPASPSSAERRVSGLLAWLMTCLSEISGHRFRVTPHAPHDPIHHMGRTTAFNAKLDDRLIEPSTPPRVFPAARRKVNAGRADRSHDVAAGCVNDISRRSHDILAT